jgi:FixJ family two-component response regulator
MATDTIVYYVGSDNAFASTLQRLLTTYDIVVQCHQDSRDFLAATETRDLTYCCLLIELEQSLLQTLSDNDFPCPMIVLTDTPDPQERQQLIEAGATDLIDKPLVSTYIYTRLAEIMPGAARMPSTPPSTMDLADGTQVTFRMMHPEDAEIEQDFVVGLSDQSRYLRFFSGIKKLPPYMLEQLTNPDFPISYALIATIVENEVEKEIGVARYAPTGDEGSAEFAVTVADEWQGHGIASQLMRGVIAAAAVGGIDRLEGIVLKENSSMLGLAKSLGFRKAPSSGEGPSVVRVIKDLREPEPVDC